ncbi:MAG: DUF86 domain-containing protein [Armatimonadota bacterium]|nr:DUF86 domain-containing protein [Armatimonadota bacterium]
MRRDIESLLDILQASRYAQSFVAGKSKEEFLEDVQCHFAVVRAIEIIGEAANRISEEFQESHSELPWRDMVNMRNRLIHVYDDVDLALVWKTVSDDIPPLTKLIEPLVPG